MTEKYQFQPMQIGEPTGQYYRDDPNLEYRLVMFKDGVNVFVSTRGAFPAWQITVKGFLSWKEAEQWFAENKENCDRAEIGSPK